LGETHPPFCQTLPCAPVSFIHLLLSNSLISIHPADYLIKDHLEPISNVLAKESQVNTNPFPVDEQSIDKAAAVSRTFNITIFVKMDSQRRLDVTYSFVSNYQKI
jgi:hypothetical protein